MPVEDNLRLDPFPGRLFASSNLSRMMDRGLEPGSKRLLTMAEKV
jgi:hypothetical protein